MSNYLVTGGAGFIGSNIVEELIKLGHSVRVLDNFATGKRKNLAAFIDKIELIDGDLRDEEVCHRAVRDMDYVLHQGAMASVPRSLADPVMTSDVNIMGTIKLLTAAAGVRVRRFVYAASSSAYGDQPVPVKSEGLLPMPLSPYAAAKLSGEYFCKAYSRSMGLEAVGLRYFNVFGPRQDPKSQYSAVIPLFVTAVIEGRRPTIYGDGLQTRDFTYVANNVQANILAATTDRPVAGKIINIACGTSFSLHDLLKAINLSLDKNIDPVFAPARKGDVKHSLADISLARELLGYEVGVDFNEGIRRTVDWYVKNLPALQSSGNRVQ
ncbi:MAG: SDR family oxidoreductase [Deltaproteobacteria bacterium]|nr:SDR family oxidoreductase [Deltaproteobacteria bacterium]